MGKWLNPVSLPPLGNHINKKSLFQQMKELCFRFQDLIYLYFWLKLKKWSLLRNADRIVSDPRYQEVQA